MGKYLALLIMPVIFAGAGFLLHAQDGAADRTRGTVLLLKTGHAMEGDIEKVGTQLCVRRARSEVWIAEDQALRLCADWDDAFRFAQAQINPTNANDRVRLARWCHTHRLTEKAIQQARLALEIQPTNADAKQIVVMLERAASEPPAKPAPTRPAIVERPTAPAPTVDVSFETQVAFATKVQPILMNKCATCHATAGAKFPLERVSDASQKAATQRNLAAVLKQINVDRPAISPLLVNAVTRHGDATSAPLKDRTAPPLQAMQQWIEETLTKNPQLKDYRAAKTLLEPKAKAPTPPPAQAEGVVSQLVPRFEIDEKNPPRVQQVESPRQPAPQSPADEFDPVHFNAWAHPAYFQPQSASNRR